MPPVDDFLLPAHHVPDVSVVICTNRASRLDSVVSSVLANGNVPFDVSLVIQGTEPVSAYVAGLLDQGKLRLVQDRGHGLSRARNIGISVTRGEIILFTDDDCVVPAGWVEAHRRLYEENPELALVFGAVDPPEVSPEKSGFVPTFDPEQAAAHGRTLKGITFGMGANMSLRRSSLRHVGLFDERMGAGAPLMSDEDLDMALRMAARRFSIRTEATARVVHAGGVRAQGAECRRLWQRDGIGLGAVLAKCMLSKNYEGAYFVARFLLGLHIDAAKRLFRGHRPTGLSMASNMLGGATSGFVRGLRNEPLAGGAAGL